MALNQPAAWILAYDIADPRRLGRVHRCVRAHGIPLQYSVFLLEKTPREIHLLEQKLQALIAADRDDIRIHRLPARPDMESLGRSALPNGADLLDSAIACWLRSD